MNLKLPPSVSLASRLLSYPGKLRERARAQRHKLPQIPMEPYDFRTMIPGPQIAADLDEASTRTRSGCHWH